MVFVTLLKIQRWHWRGIRSHVLLTHSSHSAPSAVFSLDTWSPGSALLASLPVLPQWLPAKQHCQDPNSQHSWIPVSSCHPTPARGSSPHALWDLGPASLPCPSGAVGKAPLVYLPWGIALPQGGSASHPYFLKNLFIKLIKLPNWTCLCFQPLLWQK